MTSWLGLGGSAPAPASPAPTPAPAPSAPSGASPAPSGPAAAKFRKAPIPLVEVDDDSKFSVNPEAREILEGLRGKVCVVSVAGLYRTGKSSLVNFLLDADSGFTVGPTVRRCTRGIWFWGSPRRAKLPSGEPCWVVVLDTEGLGGLEADQHYDTRIFSLATLLCSTLVYNSLGSIDEGAISNLSFVANLSQHIRVSDDGGDGDLDAHEYHKFFPSFVWVVRDFALDLVDDYGTAISSDDYLERALLATQVGFDPATTERNRVRQMMTAFFTERKCFPLVRPLLDESKLQEIDKSHLRPKEIHGRPLNGASFVGLVEQYIAAIEGGSVPTISTAWEEVMVRECGDARDAGLAAYDAAMASDDAVRSAEKLHRAHAAALKAATSTFKARAGGDRAAGYREEMEDEILARFGALAEANEARSKAFCEAKLAELHGSIVAPKMDGNGDRALLYSDASGPARDGVLAAYALGDAMDATTWLFERVDDAHEAKLQAAESQLSEAAGELAKVEAREKVIQDTLEQQQRELIAVSTAKMQVEAQVKATEARVTSLLTELQRSNRKKEELEQDLEDTKDALEAEQTWQAQLHSRLEDMETKSSHKESKLDELGKLLETHQEDAASKGEALEEQRQREKDLSAQIGAWETKHAAIAKAHESAKDEAAELARDHELLAGEHAQEKAKGRELAEKKDALNADLATMREKAAVLEARLAETTSEAGASARELEQHVEDKSKALAASVERHEQTIAELAETTEGLLAKEQELEAVLEEKHAKLESTQAELDGANATHAELLRAHAALGTEHKGFQQKMNQRITYLKSQLDEHQSTTSSTSSELQRKAVRESELEKRLEVEIGLRATMQSEKDALVFDLQKKLAETTTRLRQAETKNASLKSSLESSASELNAIAAQRAVLLDEKEKMQALWEKSLTDHFNNLHSTQSALDDHKKQAAVGGAAAGKKMEDMENQLDEYRKLVEQVQTKKEGLLRKRTRSRLVKQTWHVKLFKLVGNALLHRDTDNSASGEKSHELDADTTVEPITEANGGGGRVMRNSFKVANGRDDDLMLAAIDRVDMAEWIDAIQQTIDDMASTAKKTASQKAAFDEQGDDA
ncbi:GTPase [Aureococcus anophagefferens]|nr:GTPase [Aureococcus anophagefferens]